MTTSSSYNWTLNRDEAMLMALQEINVLGVQDTTATLAASNDYSFVIKKLNGMLKMWSIDEIKVSKRKQAFLFPALLSHQYGLGSASGSSHCTNSYKSTTLSAAAASSATTLTLTSTTGMTAADNIGIVLTDGTRYWTTIVSVDSSTQVTITAGLTSAAASGNNVVTYTTKINRPLEVIYGTTLDLTSSNLTEVEVKAISHDEYLTQPVKSTVGRPNNMYYARDMVGANPFYGTLSLFPEPQNTTTIIKLVYLDAIQDLDASTDDIELPQEWFYPVVFNLAAELAYSYGKFQELAMIQPKADKMYQLLKDASADDTALSFMIDNRGN